MLKGPLKSCHILNRISNVESSVIEVLKYLSVNLKACLAVLSILQIYLHEVPKLRQQELRIHEFLKQVLFFPNV